MTAARLAIGITALVAHCEEPQGGLHRGGALATAGNLVFLGHADGSLTAHDANTLQPRRKRGAEAKASPLLPDEQGESE